jgi:hypothetical protein
MSAFWHLADNPTAPEFVRYWTKADKVDFSARMVCPLPKADMPRATIKRGAS